MPNVSRSEGRPSAIRSSRLWEQISGTLLVHGQTHRPQHPIDSKAERAMGLWRLGGSLVLRGGEVCAGALESGHDEVSDQLVSVADLLVWQFHSIPSARRRSFRSPRMASTYSAPVKLRPDQLPALASRARSFSAFVRGPRVRRTA